VSPGDPHDSLLQGLAQGIEDGRRELAQLIEEEGTPMREGYLPRLGPFAAADQCGG
jgi:hypothetical protein